jgi:hypothetical protein
MALPRRIQRHRDNHIPGMPGQVGRGLANQQIRQERLEPEGPVVLVAMDNLQNGIPGYDCRPGVGERQIVLATVGAFKSLGHGALKWQTAPVTEWGLHPPDVRTAIMADETLAVPSPLVLADLANLRINQRQCSIGPGTKRSEDERLLLYRGRWHRNLHGYAAGTIT